MSISKRERNSKDRKKKGEKRRREKKKEGERIACQLSSLPCNVKCRSVWPKLQALSEELGFIYLPADGAISNSIYPVNTQTHTLTHTTRQSYSGQRGENPVPSRPGPPRPGPGSFASVDVHPLHRQVCNGNREAAANLSRAVNNVTNPRWSRHVT